MLKVNQITSEREIESLLNAFSDVFVPPLKSRLDIEMYSKKVNENGIVLVDEKEQGFIIFYANDKESKTAYISFIGVQTRARKKGIGKKLIKKAISFSQKNEMSSIRLEVNIDNNIARSFYQKLGFVQSSKANENSVYLTKKI